MVKKLPDPLMGYIPCKHKGITPAKGKDAGPGPCADCTFTHMVRSVGVQPDLIKTLVQQMWGEAQDRNRVNAIPGV